MMNTDYSGTLRRAACLEKHILATCIKSRKQIVRFCSAHMHAQKYTHMHTLSFTYNVLKRFWRKKKMLILFGLNRKGCMVTSHEDEEKAG